MRLYDNKSRINNQKKLLDMTIRNLPFNLKFRFIYYNQTYVQNVYYGVDTLLQLDGDEDMLLEKNNEYW